MSASKDREEERGNRCSRLDTHTKMSTAKHFERQAAATRELAGLRRRSSHSSHDRRHRLCKPAVMHPSLAQLLL